MKKIVVTGSTGFVGKILIKKLVKKFGNKNIFCLAYNKTTPMEIEGRKLLKKLQVEYQLIDLTNIKTLTNLPKNPKLIIHLAAETDTSKKDHKVNDIGTKNLYKSLGKLSKNVHFIHIGTMIEVVGRPDCSKPIDEDSLDCPTNEYTRTKLEGEKFIIKKAIENKFKLTVIRPNTIYGKGVRKNSLFDMVTDKVQKNSLITRVNWPGKSALIQVEDITNIIIWFINNPPNPAKPQKYLAYDENLSIFEISKLIHKKLKIKFKPIYIPKPIWFVTKKMRILIPYVEQLLPYSLYNYLWRFGIIIDDVVWCKTDKLSKRMKDFKPHKLFNNIGDII